MDKAGPPFASSLAAPAAVRARLMGICLLALALARHEA
jgi:hypothetical protein